MGGRESLVFSVLCSLLFRKPVNQSNRSFSILNFEFSRAKKTKRSKLFTFAGRSKPYLALVPFPILPLLALGLVLDKETVVDNGTRIVVHGKAHQDNSEDMLTTLHSLSVHSSTHPTFPNVCAFPHPYIFLQITHICEPLSLTFLYRTWKFECYPTHLNPIPFLPSSFP